MSLKIVGKKKGMTQLFDAKGNLTVCTVISAEPNVVVQVKNREKDGYEGVQLGAIKILHSKKKNVKKPLVGHYARAKVEPRRYLLESRTQNSEEFKEGQEVGVGYFSNCPFVDVCGTSKGKGYQGVMKRHGFKGGPGAHGSKFHRAAGSTGMRSYPGRNLPGGKKAGHMGSNKVTLENLQVIQIDAEKQFILVKGSVPGPVNGIVYIRKSIKRSQKDRIKDSAEA